MSYKVTGADEPAAVEVQARPDGMVADVWLRRNATRSEGEDGEARWEWDEVHLTLPGVSSPVDFDADALWEQAEEDALTAKEYAAKLKADADESLSELGSAIQSLSAESAGSLDELRKSLEGLTEWQASVKSFLSKLGLK